VVDRQEIHERRQLTPDRVPHPCHVLQSDRGVQGVPVSSR
jgi:hypothetical protein